MGPAVRRDGRSGRPPRRLAFLGVLLAGALLAVPGASGEVYQNADAHYGFTVPAGWVINNTTTGDVLVSGTTVGGITPNVIAEHEASPAAVNSSSWMLTTVQQYFDDANSSYNITVLQGPRTFIAASGRLGGDFLYNLTYQGVVLRQRQVYFVSEYYATVYRLLLTDNVSTFNTHAAEWALFVDSFHVDGERVNRTSPPPPTPPPGGDDFLLLVGGAMTAAGAIMVALAFFRMRPGRSPEAAPAPPVAFPRTPAPPPRAQGPPPGPAAGPPPIDESAAVRTSVGRRAVAQPRPPTRPPPPPRAPERPSPSMPAPGAVVDYSSAPARARVPPAYAAPPPARPPPPAAPASPVAPPTPPPPVAAPAGRAPPAAKAGPMKIRCPKCGTHFPGPTARPATVQCPNCGTKGVMK